MSWQNSRLWRFRMQGWPVFRLLETCASTRGLLGAARPHRGGRAATAPGTRLEALKAAHGRSTPPIDRAPGRRLARCGSSSRRSGGPPAAMRAAHSPTTTRAWRVALARRGRGLARRVPAPQDHAGATSYRRRARRRPESSMTWCSGTSGGEITESTIANVVVELDGTVVDAAALVRPAARRLPRAVLDAGMMRERRASTQGRLRAAHGYG